jgi:uncharacterized protein YegP (UPF0339 family)
MSTRFATLFIALCLGISFAGCTAETSPGVGVEAISGRPYFEVFQGANGQHYFRFKAANHEIILASEGYASRPNALNGVLSVVDHGMSQSSYRILQASNGQWYFTMNAVNGQVIGMSEMYGTRYDAQRGVDAVVRNVGEYQDWLANRTGARCETFRGLDSRHYFAVYSSGDAIVLQSDGYVSGEHHALNGCFLVGEYGAGASVVAGANQSWLVEVRAVNGSLIGYQPYATEAEAQAARTALVALVPSIAIL